MASTVDPLAKSILQKVNDEGERGLKIVPVSVISVSGSTLRVKIQGSAGDHPAQLVEGTNVIVGDKALAFWWPGLIPLTIFQVSSGQSTPVREMGAAASVALTGTAWQLIDTDTVTVSSLTDIFMVNMAFDFQKTSTQNNIARGIVGVDGTVAAPAVVTAQALANSDTTASFRVTSGMTSLIQGLSIGDHTFRLLASMTSGVSGWTVHTQTRATIVKVA